jgi:hypothetical protein
MKGLSDKESTTLRETMGDREDSSVTSTTTDDYSSSSLSGFRMFAYCYPLFYKYAREFSPRFCCVIFIPPGLSLDSRAISGSDSTCCLLGFILDHFHIFLELILNTLF